MKDEDPLSPQLATWINVDQRVARSSQKRGIFL